MNVPFVNGIDTGSDPLQVPFGTLLDLENGQFIQGGAINKRFGYDVLGNQTQTNTTISEGQSLATFNSQLLAFDGSSMYSYVSSGNNWSTVGPCISTIINDTQIIRTNEATQINPDQSIINGVQCIVWEDSRGGIFYSVLDQATNNFLVNEVQIDSSAFAPKIKVFNGSFIILYMLGSILNYRIVNPYNPLVLTPAVELHTDAYFNSQFGGYDAVSIAQRLFIGYFNASQAVKLYYIDETYTKSSVFAFGSGGDAFVNTNQCIGLWSDSLDNVIGAWSDGNNVWNSLTNYNMTGSPFFGANGIEMGVGQVNTITGVSTVPYDGDGDYTIFYEIANESAQYQKVHIAKVVLGTGITITAQRGAGLASKAFLHNQLPYVNIVQDTNLQATYFTIDQNKNIVAKIANEVGGGVQTNGMLPEVSIDGSNFTFANLIKGKIISQSNILFAPTGVNSTEIDFNNVSSFLNAELSNNLFIVGGVLQCYDGASITEAGFHIYPENLSAEVFSTGGSLSLGQYQYTAVYAYTDNFGQINYSATAVPITIETTTSTSAANILIPTLKLTAKTGVTIILYRTLVNSPNFYRVNSFLGNPNNPNADFIIISDTSSDEVIQSNDLVYITGGVLDNIAPPACSIICTYNNRIFLAGLEDPNTIWYSQNKSDNSNANTIPTEFSNYLTVSVNSLGGPITALLAMDANLIIFKETNIYSMSGLGPDATGNNSDYGDPAIITTDTGCNNVSSVVLTPNGIMFQSPKGIYLLDRSLTPSYIGKPVEAYNGYVITSATLDTTSNQVIFTTDGGPTLVYNYFYGKWGTWTNILTSSQGCIIWNNGLSFIKPNGLVYVQNKTSFTDAGNAISLSWTTANINLADIQGYQMIYNIYILGQFKSPHTLSVSIAYNDNPGYTEFFSLIPQNNPVGYGAGNFGDGYYGGGLYYPYQFRILPSQKRCRSIRIQVSDQQVSPNFGEGYSISNILIEVGVLPGANRLPGTGQS